MGYVILYKKIFWQLLRTEFIDLRKTFVSQALDLAIWVFCTVVVLSYLLGSQFHISQEMHFGVFSLAGCVGTVGIFDSYTRMFIVIADLEGPSTFSYYVTLPIPTWLFFVSKMIYWGFFSFLKALTALFVGKLVLWDALSFTQIAWMPAIFIFIVSNLFYGVFALLVVSLVPDMSRMRSVWMRFIFPLWIFVAVDGRSTQSEGLTIIELAHLMQELGCVHALNLDGGGSTTMVINNKIVNTPSGREYSLVRKERPISNALLLCAKTN